MNLYPIVSKAYDFLDIIYFKEEGTNPRQVIINMISQKNATVLDMCCGTLSNTLTLAQSKPDIKVMGIDLSKEMLQTAKQKVSRHQINNIHLKCLDATNTGLKSNSFDYVILGLVLHESSPQLINGLLQEAYRLLKKEGTLIILEWEPPKSLRQKLKFLPLYLGEQLNCKTFHQFYTMDKESFFKKHGFKTLKKQHCNYSIVLNLKKLPCE